MNKEKRENPARLSSSFYLIASICIIVIVGIGVIALLANTVQPTGNDRSAGIPVYQHTGSSFPLVPYTWSCVNVSPPQNSGDRAPANFELMGCGEHWVECYDKDFYLLGEIETGCYWNGLTCEPDDEDDIRRCKNHWYASYYVRDQTICEL
jgi:hypothetical protein